MRLSILVLVLVAACAPTTLPDDTDDVVPDNLVLDVAPALIEVDTISGQVDVVVHDLPTVEIRPTIATSGDSWGYTEEEGRIRLFSLCPNGTEGCSSGFSLLVPADQQLEISSTSGKVVLQATYAGAAVIVTNSAEVRGNALGAATLDVETSSGLVALAYAELPGTLDVVTVSADIEVDVPLGSYTLDISTNGDMVLEGVQQGTGPSLTLTSGSGAISVVGYDPASP